MKFTVKTYGCKVNQYESQLIRENLEKKGFILSSEGEADAVVVNTCCVTGKAEKEARSFIRKSLGAGKKVWVTGCSVRKDDRLKEMFPSAAFYPDKESFIERELAGLKAVSRFDGHTRAFVKIEDGCENFCSYCIIPLVRGRVKSRLSAEIIAEAGKLALNGYKEIVLTGIDLGAYGRDTGEGLVPLLEKLNGVKGLRRIRISSIEVFHLTDSLVDALLSGELFCPHFHIPLQSGSDRILKLMGRRYSFSDYMNIIENIRKREGKCRAAFTTDLMVGFPGETDGDFRLTCRAVEEAGFIRAHIFRYSKREGTAASLMENQVSGDIKKEREKVLENIVRKVSLGVKRRRIGSVLEVLVERKTECGWEGYSSEYLPVEFSGEGYLINEIVSVMAEGLRGDFIAGGETGRNS
ncbi:MAG: MiaB/RimO family radical SAM methylthiotransferase [Candidatus Omnitrophica bacterium]|nr:MiaB/RimO family radical SAM methylthiotransferase [Candidatus Omnitrophota bacterium]